jgi:hypothetical protein
VLRYLKAAFWFSPPLPGLGRMPLNAIAVLGLAILGLGHAAFWLLALGFEAAYLFLVATHPRFQRLVVAEDRAQGDTRTELRQRELIAGLPADARTRLERLSATCARALKVSGDAGADESLLEANGEALRQLAWMHLKLLVARQQLLPVPGEGRDLDAQLRAIENEIHAPNVSSGLRESKAATLRILRQRQENLGRREQALREVDGDLERIEAQVQLALEEAGMQGQPRQLSANIDLASRLLTDSFGAQGLTVAAIDEQLLVPPPARHPIGRN